MFPSSLVPVPHPWLFPSWQPATSWRWPSQPFPSSNRSRGLPSLSWDQCPGFLLCPVALLLPCGADLMDRFLPLVQIGPIRTPAFFFFSLCVVCFLNFFRGSFFYALPLGRLPPPLPLCVSVPYSVVSCFFFTLHPACTHGRCTGGLLRLRHWSSAPRGAFPVVVPGEARWAAVPCVYVSLLPARPQPHLLTRTASWLRPVSATWPQRAGCPHRPGDKPNKPTETQTGCCCWGETRDGCQQGGGSNAARAPKSAVANACSA